MSDKNSQSPAFRSYEVHYKRANGVLWLTPTNEEDRKTLWEIESMQKNEDSADEELEEAQVVLAELLDEMARRALESVSQ